MPAVMTISPPAFNAAYEITLIESVNNTVRMLLMNELIDVELL